MNPNNKYQNPLIERYTSNEMSANFSPNKKFSTWRRLWVALAEAERELGIDISQEQIDELKRFQNNINYDVAKARERQVRHDVMAHIYAYGVQCPKARRIIHLGATSAFVGDNTDLIQMRDGLYIILKKIVNLIDVLADFAIEYKNLPTLGFTHFQPAQLTTVGKRACLWIQDFILDLEDLEYHLKTLKFRGAKGTTGTQASFMELFDGDEDRVKKLDALVAQKIGFEEVFVVTGQTYPRKVDSQILNILSGIGQSAHKFGNDIRLLQGLKEIEEPFESEQIGSSAMAYKRNPMRCERICSLARYLISNSINPAFTTATQWFERTLDDSANRRISIPEAFMTADAILEIALNVASGIVVYPKVIERHVQQELPFMATENILMEAVKAGGDRQELHERIRQHSMQAARAVKEEGSDNDLIDRISQDPEFAGVKDCIGKIVNPTNFIGRAPQQVDELVEKLVKPIRKRYKELLGLRTELEV